MIRSNSLHVGWASSMRVRRVEKVLSQKDEGMEVVMMVGIVERKKSS